MTEKHFDIVGFDLDGTLIETSGDLAAAVNHAIGSISISPFPVEEIRGFVGRGARVMLGRALQAAGHRDEALTDQLLPLLLEYYADHLSAHSHVYPGLIAALDELKAMGLRLAVCTNKIERFTLPLLEQLDLTRYFCTIIGGDTVGILKPDPTPLRAMIDRAGGGKCLFVGDSSNDVRAAHALNTPCVAVSFGYPDALPEELGAEALIHHYDELVPLVQNWAKRDDSPCATSSTNVAPA